MIAILGLKIPAEHAHLVDEGKYQIHIHGDSAYISDYYVSDDSHVPFCPVQYIDEYMHYMAGYTQSLPVDLWIGGKNYGLHLVEE